MQGQTQNQMQCEGCGKTIQNPQNMVQREGKNFCCNTCADKNAKKA